MHDDDEDEEDRQDHPALPEALRRRARSPAADRPGRPAPAAGAACAVSSTIRAARVRLDRDRIADRDRDRARSRPPASAIPRPPGSSPSRRIRTTPGDALEHREGQDQPALDDLGDDRAEVGVARLLGARRADERERERRPEGDDRPHDMEEQEQLDHLASAGRAACGGRISPWDARHARPAARYTARGTLEEPSRAPARSVTVARSAAMDRAVRIRSSGHGRSRRAACHPGPSGPRLAGDEAGKGDAPPFGLELEVADLADRPARRARSPRPRRSARTARGPGSQVARIAGGSRCG